MRHGWTLTLSLVLLLLTGCASQKKAESPPQPATPDYGRPLEPGESALRLITDPARMPDLATARDDADILVQLAIDRSLLWFAAPSSHQWFPFDGITHDQARASLLAFLELVSTETNPQAFAAAVEEQFDVYESVGYNGEGVVLFTGYYSPVFPASHERTSRFTAPLYARPIDLATDPVTGEPLGRVLPDFTIVPYNTRKELEDGQMLAGTELVWLESALDAYIVHVNGSARLRMRDGTTMHVGYAGKTDRPYSGLGTMLVESGMIGRSSLSLSAIKKLYQRDPEAVERMILRNENYVFFTEYDGDRWPAGSLGVKVTEETTLATDKKIYPRGGVVLVDTEAVTFASGSQRFLRFLLDQDTGGAIQAPGRADIFMGVGPGAEILAGGQYAEGRLYYFFLRPQNVESTLAAE